MNKTILFEHNGKDYTLAFTRDSVTRLERGLDFRLEDVAAKPMSGFGDLFYGSFLAKQPTIKRSETDKLFSLFTNKEQLIEKLADMYASALDTLTEEPEEHEGNITWVTDW